jgi:hypothetical protein
MTPSRQSQATTTAAPEPRANGRFAGPEGPLRRFFFRPLILLLCGFGILSASLAAGGARYQTARAGGANPTAVASGEATITFRKVFKSSYPEFVEIKVKQRGMGTYDIRQLDDDASPQAFEISASLAQKIFDLAGKLHDFQGVDLEVHRRLANLGEKTFRYEKSGESHETTFNYTLDTTAAQLLSVFEGLSRQESDLSDLRRTMRYDRLGVNDVVLRIEADYDNKQLPEPEGFLDLLDQVAADQKFIDIARDRARTLAGRIRNSH